jgi:hypothetical protein
VKPAIKFRAMMPADYEDFSKATSYYPGPQFGGIVAWCWDGTHNVIMGAVGFDGWTPSAVTMHWWIKYPRCLIPLWHESLHYLAQHGKRKIIGTTPSNNVRALRTMFDKLGWQQVARIKDGWDVGVDIIISEYLINAQQSLAA